MIIKYFSSGSSSSGAVEYVEKNKTAKTLKGNNNLTRDLIKNNTNKLKYRSGVISFGKDRPSKNQVNEIINLFEESTFAGLDKDQYNSLWVEHTDTDNYHIHFVIPRLELSSMKAFNPHYHKQDQKRLLKLQDYINRKYHLINPFEADRRQTLELNTNWENRNQAKERIDQIVTTAISQEVINSRQELVSFLRDNGLEVKVSKNYIAIKGDEDKKYIRLKGAYYNENFTSREELAKELARTEQEHRADTYSELTKAREELDRLIEYKYERVSKQYKPKVREYSRENREESIQTSESNRQTRDTISRANDLADMGSDNITSINDTLHTATSNRELNGEMGNSYDTTARERVYNGAGEHNRTDEREIGIPGENQDRNLNDRGQLLRENIYQDNEQATSNGRWQLLNRDRLEQQKTINEITSIFITQEGTNNDSTRTTAKRSTRRSRETEQELIEQFRATRERVQEQYQTSSFKLRKHYADNAEGVDTKIEQYHERRKERIQRLETIARDNTSTAYADSETISTVAERFTEGVKSFVAKIQRQVQEVQQTVSRGFGLSR